ncbi:hypothetical protein MRX96_044824 [Rhipicephalus microplus]
MSRAKAGKLEAVHTQRESRDFRRWFTSCEVHRIRKACTHLRVQNAASSRSSGDSLRRSSTVAREEGWLSLVVNEAGRRPGGLFWNSEPSPDIADATIRPKARLEAG